MRLIFIFILALSLLSLPAASQMLYFDSILYCAGSVKTLVGSWKEMTENRNDGQALIRIASRSLREFPTLLDNCGKQLYAKAYRTLLSRRCIDLHELEASFTLKIIALKLQQPSKNALLIRLYRDMIGAIDKSQLKQCGFFSLQLKDILQPLAASKCITEGQLLIDSLKSGINSAKSPQFEASSLFTNLNQLGQRIFSTGKTCVSEYNDYFPVTCMADLATAIQLLSTMGEYRTTASWIWQNVRELKNLLAAIKENCPKLVLLLM